MRIDKFLKVSRLIKRRTVAKEASLGEKILINGKLAKPSSPVNVGDIIEIHYYKSHMKIKVLDLINSSKKDDAEKMYEVLEITNVNEEN